MLAYVQFKHQVGWTDASSAVGVRRDLEVSSMFDSNKTKSRANKETAARYEAFMMLDITLQNPQKAVMQNVAEPPSAS